MLKTSEEKAFAVTAAFEGGQGYQNLTGNFDGQGLSFGFLDRKSTRLNSSHIPLSRMPSSA